MATISLKRLVGYAVFILAVLILAAQLVGLSIGAESLMHHGETQQETQEDMHTN